MVIVTILVVIGSALFFNMDYESIRVSYIRDIAIDNMGMLIYGRSHVGMNNVKERLRHMCNASMEIESSPGNGCCIKITILI